MPRDVPTTTWKMELRTALVHLLSAVEKCDDEEIVEAIAVSYWDLTDVVAMIDEGERNGS